MATTTPTMRERKEPRFVQFKDGVTVRGVLIAIETAEVGGKKASRYVVMEDAGEMCAFLGTVQINSRLRYSDVGHTVEVRCEGTDSNVVKNGNAMKLFKVFVSDEKSDTRGAIIANAEISDDDFPF